MATIVSLPDEILDKILSYTTYDEVSRLRLVSKVFDAASQRVLNQGFYKVEKFHAQCLRKVKEQLPRRESERRKHHLSTHNDILTAIETRLSLLGMTFMKYVDLKYCCFIPGKVLDEIFKLLRYVSTVQMPPRAHEILQELRDISSMAMEHFDEKIAPAYRLRGNNSPKLTVTSFGVFSGLHPTYANQGCSVKGTVNQELLKLHVACKQSHNKCMELKRENYDIKRKLHEYRKKLNDQDRSISELTNTVLEQEHCLEEQHGEINELKRKLIGYDDYIVDVVMDLVDHTGKLKPNVASTSQAKEQVATSPTRLSIKRKLSQSTSPKKRTKLSPVTK